MLTRVVHELLLLFAVLLGGRGNFIASESGGREGGNRHS